MEDPDDVEYVANKGVEKQWLEAMEKRLGVSIKLVDDEEAEKAELVVCVEADSFPKYFYDDVFTQCTDCSISIRHRPHAPKKPPKVCPKCAIVRLEKENQHGGSSKV